MINIFIGILTFGMIFDCLLLILLVLVQLPKKEAGAGLAFGGGATDALFGAGSGNALTKITKYVATLFFVLAISLSLLYMNRDRKPSSLAEELTKTRNTPQTPAAIPTNLLTTATTANLSNLAPSTNIAVLATNAALPATNRPATPPK